MSPSPHAYVRAGIVVPRHKHTAVDRNTLKRRLREIVRIHVLPLGIPMDLVIWAQRGAYEVSFERLRQEMIGLLPRMARTDTPGT